MEKSTVDLLMFAVVIVDAMVRSSLPHVDLFLEDLIPFVIDTKTVDTCLYTWMVSGIFDLAKFAFFILRKYRFFSLLHYL
jgi:hypothetical protein